MHVMDTLHLYPIPIINVQIQDRKRTKKLGLDFSMFAFGYTHHKSECTAMLTINAHNHIVITIPNGMKHNAFCLL